MKSQTLSKVDPLQERNRVKIEQAFFQIGASLESAVKASVAITDLKPGKPLSKLAYQAIQQALSEIPPN